MDGFFRVTRTGKVLVLRDAASPAPQHEGFVWVAQQISSNGAPDMSSIAKIKNIHGSINVEVHLSGRPTELFPLIHNYSRQGPA